MKVDFSVISILCSRIFHDLINPAGNLDFVIQIIQEDAKKHASDHNVEAIEIASRSAESLRNRLSFMRMAIGSAGLGYGNVAFLEVRNLIDGLFIDKETKVIWCDDADIVISKHANNDSLKLLMNVFFVIFGFIHNKNLVSVYAKEIDDTLGFAISVKGKHIHVSEDNIKALQGQVDPSKLTSRNIHSYYTSMLVHQISGNLEIYTDDLEEIKIAIRYKIAR